MNMSNNNENHTFILPAITTFLKNLKDKIHDISVPAHTYKDFMEEVSSLNPEEASKSIGKIIEKTFSELESIKEQIDLCREKADTSLNKAKEAANKPVGFWHSTTPVLEALQTVSTSLAQSQIQIIETQELLFKQQRVTAEAIGFLLQLSAWNIVLTRQIVAGIKSKLEEAEHEPKISPEALGKLKNLLQQLVRQLDQMEQTEKLKNRISQLENDQKEQTEKLKNRISQLENDQELLKEQNETIEENIAQNDHADFLIALNKEAQTISWEERK